jgi:hypothetical protein
VVALALVGCGGDHGAGQGPLHPVPGCEALDHTPCDVREPSCQTRLFALAGCVRGEEPGAMPPIAVVSEADFAAMLTAEAAMRMPQPHLATWDWALSALKLIQPGGLSMDTMISQSVKQVWGVYRDDTKDITIIDHGAAFDAQSASPVLVHEFVHALQDREIDLTQFQSTFEKSGDASLASRSVVEGEARMHESRYRASVLGLNPAEVDWTRRFENTVDVDQMRLLMEPSPLTATARAFPYEWGARYVYERWALDGMGGVHGLLLAPPVTTRVLMADVGVAPEPAPERPALPVPPAGWTAVDSDVLGAWGLFLATAEGTPNAFTSELEAIALSWRADGVGIYEGPAGATALVWRIDMGSSATATQVAALLQGLPGVTPGVAGTWATIARRSDGGPLDWAFATYAP